MDRCELIFKYRWKITERTLKVEHHVNLKNTFNFVRWYALTFQSYTAWKTWRLAYRSRKQWWVTFLGCRPTWVSKIRSRRSKDTLQLKMKRITKRRSSRWWDVSSEWSRKDSRCPFRDLFIGTDPDTSTPATRIPAKAARYNRKERYIHSKDTSSRRLRDRQDVTWSLENRKRRILDEERLPDPRLKMTSNSKSGSADFHFCKYLFVDTDRSCFALTLYLLDIFAFRDL